MSKREQKYDKFATTFIIVLLSCMYFFSYMVSIMQMKLISYSYILITFGVISFVFLLIMYKKKYIKFTVNHLIISLLVLLAIISTIFSINKNNALIGSVTRYEGLFTIITYYLLYLVASSIKNDKNKKILLNAFLIIGLIYVTYGILQAYNIESFLGFIIDRRQEYVTSVVGNSNFYSAIMLMFYSLAISGFYSNKTSVLYLFPYSFAVLLANSFTGIITLGVIFISLIIYGVFLLKKFKNSEYLIKTLISFMIIAGFYFIILFSLPYYMENYFKEGKKATTDIKTEEKIDTTFGSRLYIWKNTINTFPKYILTGCGISNFELAFNPPLVDPISNLVFDKAHNEYLHKMFCEGLLSGLLYLGFIITIFVKYIINLFKIKKETFDITFPFFVAFSAYSFQALTNISVTRVSPIYFIIMGLVLVDWKTPSIIINKNK